MPTEPTNQVLETKLDSLRELMELQFDQNCEQHTMMNDHLKTLNGQVEKNTSFRQKWSGVFVAVGIVGTLAGIFGTLKNIFA